MTAATKEKQLCSKFKKNGGCIVKLMMYVRTDKAWATTYVDAKLCIGIKGRLQIVDNLGKMIELLFWSKHVMSAQYKLGF